MIFKLPISLVVGLLAFANATATQSTTATQTSSSSVPSTSSGDSATASSNVSPQYLMPPYPGVQYPAPPSLLPPVNGNQVPPYLMAPPPPSFENPLADIKSDISSLRDTVFMLSKMVAGREQDANHDEENEQSRRFRDYSGANNNNGYNAAPSYQHHAGYQEKPIVKPKVVVEKPTVITKIETKSDIKLPNLLPLPTAGSSTAVTQAQRTFAIIKRGMKNALVTGLIVALVKLAPLLWVGLRLIFNGILPLVGISLINRPPGSSLFSKTKTISFDSKQRPAADTPTVAHDQPVIQRDDDKRNDELDDELSNLEASFDIFKSGLY